MKSQIMSYNQSVPMAPWGTQGVQLKEAPTSAEAIKQAGLDWGVTLKPVLFSGGSNSVEEYDQKKVVVREDTNRPLSIVGNKWKPLQNKNAFEFFDPFVEKGLAEYSTAGYINDGERVWIMAKILADTMEVVKGDQIDSYILLTNMHSAVACGRALFTNLRLACTNMLPSLMKIKKHQKIFHMGDVLKTLTDVQEVIDIRKREFDSTLEEYRLLAKTQINSKRFQDYLKAVLTNNKKGDITSVEENDNGSYRNTLNKVTELFETGQGTEIKGVKGTLWGAYNALTEYYDYHQGRKLDNRLTSIFYGDGRKKSQKALTVALDMAA